MQRKRVPAIVQCYEDDDLTQREEIAEGTTSKISSAYLHGMRVAIKTLKQRGETATATESTDFEAELSINMTLRHPNIILLLGCTRTHTGLLQNLVFEFCQDGVLQCRRFGFSKLAAGISVCLGIARALACAHGIGIMHRDVKPSQILMHGRVPKLGDWGLAKFCTQAGQATGETGTWEFMAPEVIRHEHYNSSADVYSFGILLFCIASGEEYAYRDRYLTPMQAAMGVAKHDLRPRLSASLPSSLVSIITMCWSADAHDRPSMTELIPLLTSTQACLQADENKQQQPSTTSLYDWIWGTPSPNTPHNKKSQPEN